MRSGFPDARIGANGLSAVHNIRQFIEFQEFAESGGIDVNSWRAALQIAADLTTICHQHAAERHAGMRRW
jgi:hypothetical protein